MRGLLAMATTRDGAFVLSRRKWCFAFLEDGNGAVLTGITNTERARSNAVTAPFLGKSGEAILYY